MEKYEVLYTHQKLKKFKTWQDGILIIKEMHVSIYYYYNYYNYNYIFIIIIIKIIIK